MSKRPLSARPLDDRAYKLPAIVNGAAFAGSGPFLMPTAVLPGRGGGLPPNTCTRIVPATAASIQSAVTRGYEPPRTRASLLAGTTPRVPYNGCVLREHKDLPWLMFTMPVDQAAFTSPSAFPAPSAGPQISPPVEKGPLPDDDDFMLPPSMMP